MKSLLSAFALAALLLGSTAFAADETVRCRENISMFGGPVAKTFPGNVCPKGWHKDGERR